MHIAQDGRQNPFKAPFAASTFCKNFFFFVCGDIEYFSLGRAERGHSRKKEIELLFFQEGIWTLFQWAERNGSMGKINIQIKI